MSPAPSPSERASGPKEQNKEQNKPNKPFVPRPPKEWLELLFRWYLRALSVAYAGWGLFFLALAPRFPAAFASNPLSNGYFWGVTFLLAGFLIMDSLTRPERTMYRQYIVALVIAVLAVFIVVWLVVLWGLPDALLSILLILWWPMFAEVATIIAVIALHEENVPSVRGIAAALLQRSRHHIRHHISAAVNILTRQRPHKSS